MSLNRIMGSLLFSLVLVIFISSPSFSDVPLLINYQGKLADNQGTPLSGDQLINFYMYNVETDGTPIWTEQQSVSVNDGIFNIHLGTVSPFNGSEFENQILYLELEIFNSGSGWELLTPRQPIISTAFTIKAGNSDMLEGNTLADLNTSFVNVGEVSVVTSTMIADNSITATDLATNSVGASEISAGAVNSAELANYSVTSDKIFKDSVNSVHIAAGAVSGGVGGDLLDESVTSEDLAPDSVGSDELVEDITLGKSGDSGSLSLRDSNNGLTIKLDGASGTIYIGSAEYIQDGGSNLISTGNNSIEANGYSYTNAKTGNLFIPPPAFVGARTSDTNDYIRSYLSYSLVTGTTPPYSAFAYAPVYLPDDAVITRLDCFVYDSSPLYFVDGFIKLYRKPYNSSVAVELGEVILDTTLAYESSTPVLRYHTLAQPETVDTYSNAYTLSLYLRQETTATAQANFQGCRIIYSIATLDP